MAAQGNTSLQAEITALITGQTQDESITPVNVGQVLSDISASGRNIADDLTAISTGFTMAQIAAAIVGSTLVPLQWMVITNRPDSLLLFIQALTANTISPIGFQIKSGVIYPVFMDYLNGYEGNTKPFIASWNYQYGFSLTQVSGNANASINTILKATAGLTFGAVNAGNTSDETIACQGAVVGDPVILGIDVAGMSGTNMASTTAFSYIAFVSSVNVVTVRFINSSASTLTPNTGNFKITIIK